MFILTKQHTDKLKKLYINSIKNNEIMMKILKYLNYLKTIRKARKSFFN